MLVVNSLYVDISGSYSRDEVMKRYRKAVFSELSRDGAEGSNINHEADCEFDYILTMAVSAARHSDHPVFRNGKIRDMLFCPVPGVDTPNVQLPMP